ncbi:hypothetical protein RclHR1_16920006 [Rhizophagus clarus]|uniref:Uncharacterized protein n=1 Tax=Rhizophagus clarus TaxID=94130 RepID=A0A2Z6RBG4_9GLOM|nr:hypothetical protein RclHR1_16920006 [Rhizophagus clarus]
MLNIHSCATASGGSAPPNMVTKPTRLLPDEKHDWTFGIKVREVLPDEKHDWTFGIKVREDEKHDQTFGIKTLGIKCCQMKNMTGLLECCQMKSMTGLLELNSITRQKTRRDFWN